MKYVLIFTIALVSVIAMFVTVFLIYFQGPNSSASHLQYFGQIGDFFGGMLNPILAFASFMALLYTIRIQSKQLDLSIDELKATRKELASSRKAQQEMVVAQYDQVIFNLFMSSADKMADYNSKLNDFFGVRLGNKDGKTFWSCNTHIELITHLTALNKNYEFNRSLKELQEWSKSQWPWIESMFGHKTTDERFNDLHAGVTKYTEAIIDQLYHQSVLLSKSKYASELFTERYELLRLGVIQTVRDLIFLDMFVLNPMNNSNVIDTYRMNIVRDALMEADNTLSRIGGKIIHVFDDVYFND